MEIRKSRFLQRVWYCTHSKFNYKRSKKYGGMTNVKYSDWFIPRSHVQIGICVGLIVGDKGYAIMREWSIYKSKPEEVIEVPECDIIVSIPVDMNELLTHSFEVVRRFARDHLKVKGQI